MANDSTTPWSVGKHWKWWKGGEVTAFCRITQRINKPVVFLEALAKLRSRRCCENNEISSLLPAQTRRKEQTQKQKQTWNKMRKQQQQRKTKATHRKINNAHTHNTHKLTYTQIQLCEITSRQNPLTAHASAWRVGQITCARGKCLSPLNIYIYVYVCLYIYTKENRKAVSCRHKNSIDCQQAGNKLNKQTSLAYIINTKSNGKLSFFSFLSLSLSKFELQHYSHLFKPLLISLILFVA